MDIIFFIGRIIFGGFFVINGVNHFIKLQAMTGYADSKKVPSPKLATMSTGLLLLLSGAGIVLGIYPTLSLWLTVLFLVPTSFIMHTFWKETDPQVKMIEMTQFMKNIALAGASITLLSVPLPWAMSLM